VNVGNWDCGRAIPLLGIYVSNFRYWFFAVWRDKRNRGRHRGQSKEGRHRGKEGRDIRHIGGKEGEEGGGSEGG
jgi:hypothetical protein